MLARVFPCPAGFSVLSRASSKSFSTKTIVNSWNEWDPLKEVIVGHADSACFPVLDPGFMSSPVGQDFASRVDCKGRQTEESIGIANEQLNDLTQVLQKLGCKVHRPDKVDFLTPVQTPDFATPNQLCVACPRDVLLTVGNQIIEAPMSWRSRYFEFRAYRTLMQTFFEDDPNFLWTAAPKAMLRDSLFRADYPVTDEAELKACIENKEFAITEEEPVWDAADAVRFGKDIFMQLSVTTNQKGVAWLKRYLKQFGIRVHALHIQADLYPMHIDCTLVPLKPGVTLVNGKKRMKPWVEKAFEDNGWEVVEAKLSGDPVGDLSVCSSALAMNCLSVNHTDILVEKSETGFQEQLYSLGFNPIPIKFKQIADYGGAFHCATADVYREGGLESYFPLFDAAEARGEDVDLPL